MTEVAQAPTVPEQVAPGAPTTEEEARKLATQWADKQAARLTERVQNYLAKKNGQSNGNLAPRIGAPTTYDPSGNAYVAFDVVATSPIQLSGPPPYLPSKIIAAGNYAYLVAYIFTNPAVDIPAGWAVSASVQLGGMPWRMTLDQSNLTTGGNLPAQVQAGVFPGPAPVFTGVIFPLPTTPGPAAGADPWLIEANVTVYVDFPGKPYAAFGTNFYDIDNDPAPLPFYPPIPPQTAGWRYDLPNRYLIFNS
jgi:hypothetical protein